MTRVLRNVAIVAFLVTVLFAQAPVSATDCWWDGKLGIGPNCVEEWQELSFENCSQCALAHCLMLGAYADYDCISSCVAGAWSAGCT